MLSKKLELAEFLADKIDKITWKEITLLVLIIFILLGGLFHFCLLAPLDQRIEEIRAQIEYLDLEIGELERKRNSYLKNIPDTVELPESLYKLRAIFEQDSINLTEMLTNQLSTLNDSELGQIAIRVTLQGEKDKVIEALLNTKIIDENTFLIENLDVDQKKAVINYRLLYRK